MELPNDILLNKRQKIYKIIFWILILGIIIASIFIYNFLKSPKSLSNTGQSGYVMAPSDAVKYMLQKFSIVFPAEFNKRAIDKMPEDLKSFISTGARDLKISEVDYKDNKKGYLINFITPNDIQTAYFKISSNSVWTIIKGARMSNAAVIQLASSSSLAQITFMKIGEDADVSIQTINKK